MALPFCFIAGTTGMLSVLSLWPFIGPISLPAPFIASTAALAAGGILASRRHVSVGSRPAPRQSAGQEPVPFSPGS
jgi:hypothetical protein